MHGDSSNKRPLELLSSSDLIMFLHQRMRDYALSFEEKECERFLELIRVSSCVFHHKKRAEPHHIFGSVHGMKSADIFCVPLCRECHEKVQRNNALNQGLLEYWMKLVAPMLTQLLAEKGSDPSGFTTSDPRLV